MFESRSGVLKRFSPERRGPCFIDGERDQVVEEASREEVRRHLYATNPDHLQAQYSSYFLHSVGDVDPWSFPAVSKKAKVSHVKAVDKC